MTKENQGPIDPRAQEKIVIAGAMWQHVAGPPPHPGSAEAWGTVGRQEMRFVFDAATRQQVLIAVGPAAMTGAQS
ncbi:hypothetical protein KDA14_00110 [Candidatus Saccharibacteria bacterium]|nr:hypothetical protein [Candidatus Saccharibacteria bacterium]